MMSAAGRNNMRQFFLAAVMISIACTHALAQAYRWVDKEGRVHYTDAPPPPEAKEIQRKNLRSGSGVDTSNLPYATQFAAANFPVTLYTSPDCGPPCDNARASLVKRAVPFKEISVESQKDFDEMKKLSGGTRFPLLVVGREMQSGFRDDLFSGLLDTAGYPSSGPPMPLEALRKMDSPKTGPTQTGTEAK
jgi:glutaredoxin